MKKVCILAFVLIASLVGFSQTRQDYVDSNGWSWEGYAHNGARLAINESFVNDLGKYFQLFVMVENESGHDLQIAPDAITAKVYKKGKSKEIKVLTRDEYVKIIQQKQSAKSFGAALLNGLSEAGGGKNLVEDVPGRINTSNIDKYYMTSKKVKQGVNNAYTSYIMLEAMAGEKLELEVSFNEAIYTFEWDITKQK